ncbi:MAG: hypothetical protein ACLPHI_22455 [Terriglobales bacterium]|jgi:hypothetical protein
MTLQRSQITNLSGDSAIECLMGRMIDYAGLFPPASLSMQQAVASYFSYLRSEYRWVLGRFIVPAQRLAEFESALDATDTVSRCCNLSILLGPDPQADVDHIGQFNARRASLNSGTKVVIESVEGKASNPDEVLRLDAVIPHELLAYFELPLSGRLYESIAGVEDCSRRGLKIRMGGETADKFPASEAVMEFLRFCVSAGLPFKATAGLHHPVRSIHRLTHEPDSASATMHGFLNLFLGAAFLRAGMDDALAFDVLNETLGTAFRFDEEGVWWREHRLSARELFLARRDFAISFGSCSFTEPVDDLRSLHLL